MSYLNSRTFNYFHYLVQSAFLYTFSHSITSTAIAAGPGLIIHHSHLGVNGSHKNPIAYMRPTTPIIPEATLHPCLKLASPGLQSKVMMVPTANLGPIIDIIKPLCCFGDISPIRLA